VLTRMPLSWIQKGWRRWSFRPSRVPVSRFAMRWHAPIPRRFAVSMLPISRLLPWRDGWARVLRTAP